MQDKIFYANTKISEAVEYAIKGDRQNCHAAILASADIYHEIYDNLKAQGNSRLSDLCEKKIRKLIELAACIRVSKPTAIFIDNLKKEIDGKTMPVTLPQTFAPQPQKNIHPIQTKSASKDKEIQTAEYDLSWQKAQEEFKKRKEEQLLANNSDIAKRAEQEEKAEDNLSETTEEFEAGEAETDQKKEVESFEPQSLDDFIGQTQVVNELREAIAVAKFDGMKCIAPKGGVLFLGNKGLGKTTLMELVAKELGVKCEKFDASGLRRDVTSRKTFDLFLERIAKENVPVVIAVDEIHSMPQDIQSRLLTLLQSRVYSNLSASGIAINLPIKEFTFIGATTEPQGLLETVYDRFNKGLICTLVDYTSEELKRIINQKAAYYKLTISEGAKDDIVARGRSSVREIESYILKLRGKAVLAEKTEIDEILTEQFFNEAKIDKTGLYAKDIEILEALKSAPNRTLSEENIANKVHISLSDFQSKRKPFLVRQGFIVTINRGQCLTEKAVKYLSESHTSDGL